MGKYFKYLQGDKGIWMIAIILLGISAVSVFSFVPILVRTEGGTPLGYLGKHVLYIFIGFAIMFWMHKQNPKYIEKLSKFIFVSALCLLIFTFFFGIRINDATRWVKIPIIGLTFQSSDFAKLALIIFLARRLTTKREYFDSWQKGFWPVLLPVIIICALIAKDNFSTAAIVFMISLVMLYVAKIPFGKMTVFLSSGIALLGLIVLLHIALPDYNILPRYDTWIARFSRAYVEQETIENFQAQNAQLAIHNGGYFGVGIGQGELKYYTPEAYADFFYSSFVEEFGLVFAILLAFFYLILFYRILKIGLRTNNLFYTYVCLGIGLTLMSQALVNMFVCTGLMPVTGQIMPLLAMGGSAMVITCASLGIVLAIANQTNLERSQNIIKE